MKCQAQKVAPPRHVVKVSSQSCDEGFRGPSLVSHSPSHVSGGGRVEIKQNKPLFRKGCGDEKPRPSLTCPSNLASLQLHLLPTRVRAAAADQKRSSVCSPAEMGATLSSEMERPRQE